MRAVSFAQGHGVLKVKHDGVGAVDKGGREHGGISARQEQHTAAEFAHFSAPVDGLFIGGTQKRALQASADHTVQRPFVFNND